MIMIVIVIVNTAGSLLLLVLRCLKFFLIKDLIWVKTNSSLFIFTLKHNSVTFV